MRRGPPLRCLLPRFPASKHWGLPPAKQDPISFGFPLWFFFHFCSFYLSPPTVRERSRLQLSFFRLPSFFVPFSWFFSFLIMFLQRVLVVFFLFHPGVSSFQPPIMDLPYHPFPPLRGKPLNRSLLLVLRPPFGFSIRLFTPPTTPSC